MGKISKNMEINTKALVYKSSNQQFSVHHHMGYGYGALLNIEDAYVPVVTFSI